MAGKAWSDTGSGYLANPTLSDEFRTALQPLARFRQFCDVEAALGKNRGEEFQWNVYGDTVDDGGVLAENAPMPESSFPISQGSAVIKERGLSVPYTGKLENLAEHDIRKIVFQTLRNDANRTMDRAAHAQFDNAILQYVATGANAYTLDDDGTTSTTNANAMDTTHVKQIADLMQERNIPVFDGENYVSIGRPTTFRPFKDDLETLHSYTSEGWNRVMNGENGRYEGIRFVTQTNIPSEDWSINGASDAAYFFGADTVTEAVACPEEIRAKIPDDYGRGRGIAWYALNAFGITHADVTDAATKAQARIIKWDSAESV
jgi:N4-gp56 family major capsid protein